LERNKNGGSAESEYSENEDLKYSENEKGDALGHLLEN